MARKVYFHVGLPKTGTTYLQTIMWNNVTELRRQGVLLPGHSARQHLWASGVVREDPNLDRRGPEAKHAWARIVEEVNGWDGTAVVSHEFFAGASAAQAERAITDVAGAEVHVVVTARDTLSLVTARWQEFVKNGSTTPIDDYPASDATDPVNEWDWGTMDVGDVVTRWGASLPPERVHVLTLPRPTEPRETLWLRFAGLLGIDATRCDAAGSEQNESLGVVEVELLRRVNGDLTGFGSPLNRGVWIRGYLAQGKLVPRRGDKFWPSPARVEQIRARGERAVAVLKDGGYDVVGDVEDLRTPADLPERRHPGDVTDAEMLSAATATIAAMLSDVRRLTNRQNGAGSGIRGRIRARTRLRRVAARLRRRAV
ncbi:MAG: hypothetical protein ACXVXC_10950 [Nocardioidaceae bacterium]